MAARDFMPFRSPHGGSEMMGAYPVAAAQAFLVGEPLEISGNQLVAAGDDPPNIIGLAAVPATVQGAAAIAGTLLTIYRALDSQLFVTRRFARDGAGTLVAPAATDIGNLAGISLAGGIYSLDTGAANLFARVEAVLDEKGLDLGNQHFLPGTPTFVVCRFVGQ